MGVHGYSLAKVSGRSDGEECVLMFIVVVYMVTKTLLYLHYLAISKDLSERLNT
jgi:hypothetical protein